MKSATTLQAQVNLIKSSLTMTKKMTDVGPRLQIQFKFDSSAPCSVKFFWIANEDVTWEGDNVTGLR
jgi:hypothetical protein